MKSESTTKHSSARKHFCLSAVLGLFFFLLTLGFIPAPAEAAGRATVDILAVGDDLVHSHVYRAHRTKKGYDFTPIYKMVKDDIREADLAVINQETILVDKDYSTYPRFGSPKAVADAIAKVGFDIVTHATNHTLDRGVENILGTMKYWREKYPEITVLGIHKTKNEANTVTVVEKNGIRIAMLNYTYGLNGRKLPRGKEYMIDLLKDKNKVRSDIRKAKKVSDFVIVFPHWGSEYVYKANSFQRSWATLFMEEGVDVVIGAHPHVLQPYRMLHRKDGHRTLVYYSLGNFVSGQSRVPRMLGGMAKLTLIKDRRGCRIGSYTLIPIINHVSSHRKTFTVYKLSDYTEALAAKHDIHRLSPREKFSLAEMKKLYKKITGKEAP